MGQILIQKFDDNSISIQILENIKKPKINYKFLKKIKVNYNYIDIIEYFIYMKHGVYKFKIDSYSLDEESIRTINLTEVPDFIIAKIKLLVSTITNNNDIEIVYNYVKRIYDEYF